MKYLDFIKHLYRETNRQFDDVCTFEGYDHKYGSITKKNRKGYIIGFEISNIIMIILSFIKIPLSLWFLMYIPISILVTTHVFSFGLISYCIQYVRYKYNKSPFQLLINEFMESKEEYEHLTDNGRSFIIKKNNRLNYIVFKGIIHEKKKIGYIKIKITYNKIILKKQNKIFRIKRAVALEELKKEIALRLCDINK